MVFLSQRALSVLTYGDERPPVVRGAHSCMRRTIYLRTTFSERKPADRSTLLHELVHHLQCRSPGYDAMTLCQKERQAYEVERVWLRRQGIDFYATFNHTRRSFENFMKLKCP